EFGRQSPGRRVRRINETELLQVRHHVAHGGGRERRRDQAGDITRAYRFAGSKVAFDNLPEDIARALVELSEAHLRRADRDVVGQGSLRSSVTNCPFRPPSASLPALAAAGAAVSLCCNDQLREEQE